MVFVFVAATSLIIPRALADKRLYLQLAAAIWEPMSMISWPVHENAVWSCRYVEEAGKKRSRICQRANITLPHVDPESPCRCTLSDAIVSNFNLLIGVVYSGCHAKRR